MKVINLTASLSRKAGGLYYSVSGLVKAQRHCGIDAEGWGLVDTHFENDRCEWGDAPVRAFKVYGPQAYGYAPGMLDALCSTEPDVVHSHGIWMYPSIAAGKWARRTGRPMIVSPHGMLDRWARRNSALRKSVAWITYQGGVMRTTRCIRALCKAEAESIREVVDDIPIATIPNGIDIPPVDDQVCPDYSEGRAIVYLGRIHRKKNLVALAEAWRNIPRAKRKGWRIRIAGWGDEAYTQKLKAYADQTLSIEGAQYGEDKRKYLGTAAGFILPSYSEGLPMAALEAMSLAVPVIMTRECNIPEAFSLGAALECGTDKSEMAIALKRFMDITESERRHMGINGKALVFDRYSWGVIGRDMLDTYRWLLGQGTKPKCVDDLRE